MPGGFCTVLGILYVAPGHLSSILEYDVNGLRGVYVESGALGHRSDVRHVGQYRNVLGGAITGARYRYISRVRYSIHARTGQFVRTAPRVFPMAHGCSRPEFRRWGQAPSCRQSVMLMEFPGTLRVSGRPKNLTRHN